MHARIAVYATLIAIAIGGVAAVADALVTTDEERLAVLGDVVVSERRVEGVLAWTDPSREPVRLRDESGQHLYGEDDDLAAGLATSLEPLEGARVDVVQRAVDVRGDRATLALRLRVDGELRDVSAVVLRNGQGWLVSELRVR